MPNQTISIIGLGWIGLPLAENLVAEEFRVKGSVTSAEKKATLREKGIDTYQLQLNPEPIGDLDTLLQTDTLVINVPPKAGKFGDTYHPQQIQFLTDAIQNSPVRNVLYVSSTSVYPDISADVANHVVRETDVTLLDHSAAPALFQAEDLIRGLSPDRLVTIVRCAGLMGYDRIPGKYVAGRSVDSGRLPVNYLHQDDAVGILTALIQQPISGTFNAVAPEHPAREAIYRKSCAQFGYGLPTFVEPKGLLPYKIVSGQKLDEATRYIFKYSDPLQFFYKR
ncbi:SDR family NAD(P)-dependent oxidoreductase [Spirosoma sp. BT702]|uniref:SDR family NAD(P)-dependent oxidoreductase n=1 Tax=Spirosoma profusum TaxID=2771354 RepID=A0A927AQ52_9BACT|nr:SDR family NAD(P)-dependent oxidoreductase [Spirosoma profusum]MBD2699688.1 SDR family NAD(P)-dependent oxidoreductase [Spirosoma profusum]